MRSLSTLLIAGLLFFSNSQLFAEETSAKPFQDGDIVAFLGDSITHVGSYPVHLQVYYATRFPDRKIRFYNSGIIGNQASNTMRRLDWDLHNLKPTVVSLMLGMNDVGRSLYDPKLFSKPETQGRKDSAIANYKEKMPQLVDMLLEKNYRLILVTPTPYDQTCAAEPTKKYPNFLSENGGANDGLAILAEFVRNLAAEKNLELIKWHGPLTALTLKEQEKDPLFTLINPDRVHPGRIGHFAMAYYYLKDQGVPQYVSKVVVDAGSSKVVEQMNAEIKDLKASSSEVSFTCHEKALPFPKPRLAMFGNHDLSEVLKLVDFEKDLNQEILSVKGLSAGSYELSIDGQAVGTYSNDELNEGINLAFNEKTPQHQQADKLHDIAAEKTLLEISKLRKIAAKRHGPLKTIDGSDLEAVKAFGEANPNKKKTVEEYLKLKEEEPQSIKKFNELADKMYELNKPVPHQYSLKKM